MSVFGNMYDFVIAPIREADQREGNQFLERYFYGPQQIWEEIDQSIKDIPKLWSVTECPDEYLKYLKWIVGWTSQLDNITRDLTFDELRRLVSISGRLWKLRGTEFTIEDVMFFATGMRNRWWNWFDFRWVLADDGQNPDNVADMTGYLKLEVNDILGTTPRPGTPLKVEYIPTATSEEDLLSQWDSVNLVNYVETTSTLGQGGSPSTSVSDYFVYDTVHLGTELGVEHEGRDPWMIALPDPDVAGSNYESNLRIVDDGTLNRTLVVNLMTDILRATGEKWEIIYLAFLDRFTLDGDDTQWTMPNAYTHSVENGYLTYYTKSFFALAGYAINPEIDVDQAIYFTRFRGGDPFTFVFHLVDSLNYYYVMFSVGVYGVSLATLRKVSSGGTSDLDSEYLPFDRNEDTWFGLRVSIVDEDSGKRIKVFLDAVELISYLDSDTPHQSGGVGLGGGGDVWVDEVEVLPLPAEGDYVELNS